MESLLPIPSHSTSEKANSVMNASKKESLRTRFKHVSDELLKSQETISDLSTSLQLLQKRNTILESLVETLRGQKQAQTHETGNADDESTVILSRDNTLSRSRLERVTDSAHDMPLEEENPKSHSHLIDSTISGSSSMTQLNEVDEPSDLYTSSIDGVDSETAQSSPRLTPTFSHVAVNTMTPQPIQQGGMFFSENYIQSIYEFAAKEKNSLRAERDSAKKEKESVERELFSALEKLSQLEVKMQKMEENTSSKTEGTSAPVKSDYVTMETYMESVARCESLEQLLETVVRECSAKDNILRGRDATIADLSMAMEQTKSRMETLVSECQHVRAEFQSTVESMARDNTDLHKKLKRALEVGKERDEFIESLEESIKKLEKVIVNETRWSLGSLLKRVFLPPGDLHKLNTGHWVSDSSCSACQAPDCSTRFGVLSRRHHCRRCGNLFCAAHVSQRTPLSLGTQSLSSNTLLETKVCDRCFHHLRHSSSDFIQFEALVTGSGEPMMIE